MAGRNKWPPRKRMQLQPGDFLYYEYIVRQNHDGTYTIYRDGWNAPYTTRL